MNMVVSDGVSIMLGKLNSVAASLCKSVPHLTGQHGVWFIEKV